MLVERFAGRYPNRNTSKDHRTAISMLFEMAGVDGPAELGEQAIVNYVTHGDRPSNNTVYQRLSQVRTFLRWCRSEGICDNQAAERLAGRDSPLRSYKRVYGKKQDRNPARWLTHEEAFGQLVGACQDGTIGGLRDEVIVRLGLAGMRVREVSMLTVGSVSSLPSISWMGKGRASRQITAGPALCTALEAYLAQYRSPTPTSRLICGYPIGRWAPRGPAELAWNTGMDVSQIYRVITRRARQAGLGHVAPHDLRRSAAGILHNAVGDDGGHRFDLLDIQRVLGHADPATTMKCYLEPMDTAVLDRAAGYLD